jgi:hypothetical protein
VFDTNGGSGALEVGDFSLSISGGTATVAATPASISNSGNVYTLGLTLTGTPNGSETLTIVPSSSTAIYDTVGNAASTTQTNNTVSLIDQLAPTIISSTTIASDNSTATVTFSEAVFDTNGGSGALEVGDFSLSISGGTATVAATPASISNSGNVYTLGLTLTGTPNGSETLTIVPSSSTAIYDTAGNAASTTQTNNTVSLIDQVSPTITLNTASLTFIIGQEKVITATVSKSLYFDGSLLAESNKPATNITVNASSSGTTSGFFIVSPTIFTFKFMPRNISDTLTVSVASTIADIAGNTISDFTISLTASSSGPILKANACFPRGTPIHTDQGIVAIDKINIETHTIRGNKIKTITQTYLVGNKMVLFKKNSLHNNVPYMDTIMSPHHKVYYNKEMIEAYKFIKLNKAEYIEFLEDTVIYNVLLDNHEKMVINNMIVETQDPHSTTGYFYNNFILNENCSKKDVRYATELLSLFNTENWRKVFIDVNIDNLVGTSLLYATREWFKVYLVQHQNKNKKRAHKIMDKLIPVHK